MKVLTYDEALDEAGGFGRYQLYAIIMCIASFSSSSILVYNFSYYQLAYMYECEYESAPTEYVECTADIVCDPITYHNVTDHVIDWESPFTIRNWQGQIGLECVEPSVMGLIGSCYFIGKMFGIAVVRFADVYGRRPLILIGLVVHLASYGAILFNKNLILLYITMVTIGTANSIVSAASYMMGLEIIPPRNRYLVASLLFSLDVSAVIYVSFYFMWISDNWVYINYVGVGWGVVIFIFEIFFLKESPKFYVSVKRYHEARKIL